MRRLLPLIALVIGACHRKDGSDLNDDTAEAWRPDQVCPGDAGCETSGGQLEAGAAAISITPTCYETWVDSNGDSKYERSTDAFIDCGCDRLCEDDPNYPGPDEGEADGIFQAIWLAGFGNGRAAQDVHDDIWARAIALREGDTTIAIVALDVVGFFNDDVQDIRQRVAELGVDVDRVIVTSTHNHEAPDTMGMWGQNYAVRGVDADWLNSVKDAAAEAVAEAVSALQPASLEVASVNTAAPFGDKGTANLVRDSRDPRIIDEMMYVARFVNRDHQTVATLVNWGNHAEVMDNDNTSITSDFVGYLRDTVEDGVIYDSYTRQGVGGICIFLQAEVGGLMTPLGITVTDGDGNEYSESGTWEKTAALGRVAGELALDGIEQATEVSDPLLAFRAATLYLPIKNVAFQALWLAGVFDRPAYDYDPDQPLSDTNVPSLQSEIDVIDLGPIRMMTIPGELFPEIAIGGYDGSHLNTTYYDFIDADNPNPPDLSQAPEPPYLKDLMGAQYNWILGLGNDEIGYIVPSYDFQVDSSAPYLVEAPGDHYEETNSLGPDSDPVIEAAAKKLLEWSP